MVTARAEESDAVVGLSVGADGLRQKPFGMKESSPRAVVLRRTAASADPSGKVVRADELEVTPPSTRCGCAARELGATPTELRLLHHLVRTADVSSRARSPRPRRARRGRHRPQHRRPRGDPAQEAEDYGDRS